MFYNKEQKKRLAEVRDATREYCRILTMAEGDATFDSFVDDIAETVGNMLRDRSYNVYIPHIKRDAAGCLKCFDQIGEDEAGKAAMVREVAHKTLVDICSYKNGKFIYKLNKEDAAEYENVKDPDELYGKLVDEKEDEIFFSIYYEINKEAPGIIREDRYQRVLRGFLKGNVIYDDSALRGSVAGPEKGETKKTSEADQIKAIAREVVGSLCPYDKKSGKFICELDPSETWGEDINDPEAFVAKVLRDEQERIFYNVKYAINCNAPGALDKHEFAVKVFIDENVLFDDTAIREELNLPGR